MSLKKQAKKPQDNQDVNLKGKESGMISIEDKGASLEAPTVTDTTIVIDCRTVDDQIAEIVEKALPPKIGKQIDHITGAVEGDGYPVCYLYPNEKCKLFDGLKENTWNEDNGLYVERDQSFGPAGVSVEFILGDNTNKTWNKDGSLNTEHLETASKHVADALSKRMKKVPVR